LNPFTKNLTQYDIRQKINDKKTKTVKSPFSLLDFCAIDKNKFVGIGIDGVTVLKFDQKFLSKTPNITATKLVSYERFFLSIIGNNAGNYYRSDTQTIQKLKLTTKNEKTEIFEWDLTLFFEKYNRAICSSCCYENSVYYCYRLKSPSRFSCEIISYDNDLKNGKIVLEELNFEPLLIKVTSTTICIYSKKLNGELRFICKKDLEDAKKNIVNIDKKVKKIEGMGEISNISVINSYFYVITKNNKVFCFDPEGHFIETIDMSGDIDRGIIFLNQNDLMLWLQKNEFIKFH
jgi:hypothetical protein